jgi:hypothetical protein
MFEVKRVVVIWLVGMVCASGLARAQERPTFTRDVLPILQDHCQSCHRPGQIAPMSLLDYATVRPWAKSIRNVVAERTMPPFAAAGPIGKFEGDIRLNDEQIDTIVAWVDAGAPRGNPQDAPAPVEWPEVGRVLDDVDLVVGFPDVESTDENTDEWVLLYSDHVFEEETWIESFELVLDDATIVHHAGVSSVGPDFYIPESGVMHGRGPDLLREGKQRGQNLNLMTQNHLFTWLPGLGVERRPGGVYRIGAGERLVLQTHIAPTPEARKSKVQMAIRLADGVWHTDTRSTLVRFKDEIQIAPGDSDFTLKSMKRMGPNAELRSLRVHMHARGKSAVVRLHYPDGRTETVLDIPRWNFDWQRTYHLKEPVSIPPRTEMEVVAVWDNSENNPINPDPTESVAYGPQTSDEMFSVAALLNFEAKEPIVFKKGRLVSGDPRIKQPRAKRNRKKPAAGD